MTAPRAPVHDPLRPSPPSAGGQLPGRSRTGSTAAAPTAGTAPAARGALAGCSRAAAAGGAGGLRLARADDGRGRVLVHAVCLLDLDAGQAGGGQVLLELGTSERARDTARPLR